MSDIFPKWTNKLPAMIIAGGLLVGGVVTAGVTYYLTPKYARVGYTPVQQLPSATPSTRTSLGWTAATATMGSRSLGIPTFRPRARA